MFTGIIEEMGTVVALERRGNLARLRVRAELVLADAALGDSLAHDGVCLTIAELHPPEYLCDVMAETLRRTTLGELKPGARLNLERALAAGGRFGGHFVQGHVDGVGTVRSIARDDQWVTYEVAAPDEVLSYVAPQGSIAVDGVSLTVVERRAESFTVALIPHTLAVTTLGERRAGDRVNLEADVLAKYVAAAMGRVAPAGGRMSLDWLAEHGYGPERAGER